MVLASLTVAIVRGWPGDPQSHECARITDRTVVLADDQLAIVIVLLGVAVLLGAGPFGLKQGIQIADLLASVVLSDVTVAPGAINAGDFAVMSVAGLHSLADDTIAE